MKVLIAGDYVPRERVASMMQKGDFSYFDDVKIQTKQADLSILNLEAPIVIKDAKPIVKCGPNLKTSKEVIDSLKYAGFNMVTLANNHIMDYGDVGLSDTMNSLKAAGIKYVGVGNNLEDAKTIVYFEKDGKRLAIINCCEHEFSIATNDKAGANPLNPISQYYSIREAKANADFVLVIVHGGHEHWQLPSPRMVETYRFFIDAGADAVVNHHQHCYSGYELYKNKPILYGLGNLCFESLSTYKQEMPWHQGYIVVLNFAEGHTSFDIHPYVQCWEEPNVKLIDRHAFDYEIAQLINTIKNTESLDRETQKYYDSSKIAAMTIFEAFGGRVLDALRRRNLIPLILSKKQKLRIENYVNCESHRDKISYAFKHSK